MGEFSTYVAEISPFNLYIFLIMDDLFLTSNEFAFSNYFHTINNETRQYDGRQGVRGLAKNVNTIGR